MKQSKRIKVRACTDVMGNLFVRPDVDRFAEAYRAAVVANGGPDALAAFRQEGTAARQELLDGFPDRKVRELERGWPVVFLADPWTVGHWYGYDAQETVELPWGR